MTDRIPTTYAGLLGRLARDRLLGPDEAARVWRLLEEGDPAAIAIAAHELVRRLVRAGALMLREGDLNAVGEPILVSDPRHGHLFRLPAVAGGTGVIRLPLLALDPQSAQPAPEDLARLLRFHDRLARAPIEQAADLKAVVLEILDLAREMTGAQAALFFTRNPALPRVIARGTRSRVMGIAEETPPQESESLPRAWIHWLESIAAERTQAIYLPDFQRLEEERRPLPSGSALLIALDSTDPPWEGTLALLADQPGQFVPEQHARIRMLAERFAAQLGHAARLQAAVAIDYLTRIHNRGYFIDQFARTLDGARRKRQRFALLIIDIDDFREFNKRYGFDAGDEVLRAAAQAMARVLRSTDVIARYGGEEFAVLLAPDLTPAEAEQIGGRLRAAVAALPIEVPVLDGNRRPVTVTVSIGGAIFPKDGTDRDGLWSWANRMLIELKLTGKNGVRFVSRS